MSATEEHDDAPEDEPKLAEQVLAAVLETEPTAKLFLDERGRACALIPHGNGKAWVKIVRLEPVPITSQRMLEWVSLRSRRVVGKTIGRTTIDEARLVMRGLAQEREMLPTSLRIARTVDAIYVDLGDKTGEAIEVDAKGWRVVSRPPESIMFRRPETLRPLARPERGGSLDDLRPFVRLMSDESEEDGFLLFVAWILGAFHPEGPYPVLGLHGEMGSTKSTHTMMARLLIDPNAVMLRKMPEKPDDLVITALHSHVMTFDNQSGIKLDMSDSLCRLATGGGIATRKLYENDEESAFNAKRPVILNGIDDVANRDDLIDRSLVLRALPVPSKERKSESVLFAEFNAAAPRILGAILDGLSAALANIGSVQLEELPRMADFALWISAAETGLAYRGAKLSPGTMMGAYRRNLSMAQTASVEASKVSAALVSFMSKRGRIDAWSGEPSTLLGELNKEVGADFVRNDKSWPKSAQAA